MKKVLMIGSTVCDIVLNLDHLPTRQEDVHPEKQTTRIGGCAFNAAHALAHLGIPYTFISPLGTGVYGDFIRKEIKRYGLESSVFVDEEIGSCLCFVEKDGERTFLSMHGAEYTFQPEWLNSLNLEDYELGYFCGLEIEDRDGQALTDFVCSSKIQFLFAPGPRILHIQKDRMNQLLDHGVMLHLSDLEAMNYTQCTSVETAAEKLYEKTKNLVIVTCGEKGCYLKQEKGIWVNSIPVKVADTIGAGDSHAGAFLAAMYRKKSFLECAAFANKVAGKVVSSYSSVLSDEDAEELKKMI
ncbi:MAG: carbohydrate kinase family protein [Erysipelotrichaceae bacterium]|nr:carbohydrate kinase family protein [Erysipelotrichaceae bacterium]